MLSDMSSGRVNTSYGDRPKSNSSNRPCSAIVLCNSLTGLATVRSLADAGIAVYAYLFDDCGALAWSRYGNKVDASHLSDAELIAIIQEHAKHLSRTANPQADSRPVVLPTSDAHALLLAEHRAQLEPHCRIASTTHAALSAIVRKDLLYQTAQRCGVAVVPSIASPLMHELEAWSLQNSGPYLLKPVYEAMRESSLKVKNCVLQTRQDLLDFVHLHGSHLLVIQQLLWGGDGEIYDAYGCCDAQGRVLTMASHRRIRQYPQHLGTTVYGEIPAQISAVEKLIFEPTERLLASRCYQGIFGIEWLHESKTNRWYLIDFNARPFTTIGHLNDCGLNLPALAYADLCGTDLSHLPARPKLKHLRWVNFPRDIARRRNRSTVGAEPLVVWLKSLLQARSFGYWRWTDPGPSLYKLIEMGKQLLRNAIQRHHPDAKSISHAPANTQAIGS